MTEIPPELNVPLMRETPLPGSPESNTVEPVVQWKEPRLHIYIKWRVWQLWPLITRHGTRWRRLEWKVEYHYTVFLGPLRIEWWRIDPATESKG